MADKVVILGSGAAPGVPSATGDWGVCDPQNPKNFRRRAGVYIEMSNTKILVDTSADLRMQLLDNHIQNIDAVLYTHTHADHLHGIDDLRSVNRFMHSDLNIYATADHLSEIRRRMPYVMTDSHKEQETKSPRLYGNVLEYGKKIEIGNVDITPFEVCGHTIATTSYDFDNGKVVLISDYKYLPPQTFTYLQQLKIKILIMPQTTPNGTAYHASLQTNIQYARQLNAEKVILTHMATECDYDEINRLTPDNVYPAYDNMVIDIV